MDACVPTSLSSSWNFSKKYKNKAKLDCVTWASKDCSLPPCLKSKNRLWHEFAFAVTGKWVSTQPPQTQLFLFLDKAWPSPLLGGFDSNWKQQKLPGICKDRCGSLLAACLQGLCRAMSGHPIPHRPPALRHCRLLFPFMEQMFGKMCDGALWLWRHCWEIP